MKKIVKSIVILAVLAVAVGSAGAVFAQTSSNNAAPSADARAGRGGFGRGGGLMDQDMRLSLDGVLHDALVAAYAEALGLPVDEIEARLEDGETMADIATSTGLTVEEFKTLMDEILQQVVDQAVEDGLLTEEQAEWFLARGSRMFGGARMSGREGMPAGRGAGRGQSGTGTCLDE